MDGWMIGRLMAGWIAADRRTRMRLDDWMINGRLKYINLY